MASILSRRRSEHMMFSGIAILLIGYALLGFWQSYFVAGLVLAPLPSLLVHVHAVLFVGWITLFFVQTALIASNNHKIHRRLGLVMGWWAVAIILIGPATVIMAVRRQAVGAGPFAGDLAQTLAFAILCAAGLSRRREGPTHKRLMTLASAAIIGPAIIRWPFEFILREPPVGVLFFYLLPALLLIGYDLATLRRVHCATWLGFGLLAAVLISFIALPAWPGWITFFHWVQRA